MYKNWNAIDWSYFEGEVTLSLNELMKFECVNLLHVGVLKFGFCKNKKNLILK